MSESGSATVLVASNRGPVSFALDSSGVLSLSRGGGGLVSGMTPAARGGGVVWVCAALSAADRVAARAAPRGRLDEDGHDTDGIAVRMLDIDPATFHRAYNAIANSTLWFIHHLLYDTPFQPQFDAGFAREWAAYEDYGRSFATALADEAAKGAKVLVQDYHLCLTPAMLREIRPDLRIGHFSHTPWAPPDYYRLLPDDVARQVLEGILGADNAGFLTYRWAAAFLDCCEAFLDVEVDRAAMALRHRGRVTHISVHSLGIDGSFLRDRALQPDVELRLAALLDWVGDRRVIVRVDRTELSKNIVRGLMAYREFLRTNAQWHNRVVHIACAYPSRHDLPEYREYTAAVQRIAKEIEDEFAAPGWQPLLLQVDDDFARSLAAYRLADVALVNPVRDGMNLVAKEVTVVSERGCAVVLSTEAGAAAELGQDALLVNPYDISGTARALRAALEMSEQERYERCKRLADVSTELPPQAWFADQLAEL